MQTTDRDELERTKEFVYNYRIQNIEFKNKQEYDRIDYQYYNYGINSKFPEYVQHRIIGTVSMDISERDFLNIVKKVTEYDEFMRCPEVREAIYQAMFIGRLKGYR